MQHTLKMTKVYSESIFKAAGTKSYPDIPSCYITGEYHDAMKIAIDIALVESLAPLRFEWSLWKKFSNKI